jgi:hypothetical protein
MANPIELGDRAEDLQAKATEHEVPAGVWALFGGLILWGVYYFFTYVGWDQAGEVTAGQTTALGTNVGSTIAFTAIATAVAVALAVSMARRGRGKK